MKYVAQSQSRVISIVAPAGFGKSTLAELIAAETEKRTLCDAASVSSVFAFAGRIIAALQTEASPLAGDSLLPLNPDVSTAQLEALVVDAWTADDPNATWIFDNLEAIADQPQSLALLARLVRTPSRRKLILCSRPPFPLLNSRLIPPNEHIRLSIEDLAFTRGEAEVVLGDLVDAERLDKIMAVTQGWPVAVLLKRQVVRAGRLDRMRSAVSDSSYFMEDIRDYLMCEVIRPLASAQFDMLLAIVATRYGARDAVFRADPEIVTTSALEALERQFPLIRFTGDGRYVAHPLIVSLLEDASPLELERLRIAAADSYQRDGLLGEAAQLYFDAGQFEKAAACLEQTLGSYLDESSFKGLGNLTERLPAAVRSKYPLLWARLAHIRRIFVPLKVLLAEGKLLRNSLHSRPSSLEAREIDAVLVTFATQLGHDVYAQSILADHCIDEDSPGQGEAEILIAATTRAVFTGRTTGARERYERLLPLIHNDLLRAYFILRVDATIEAMCGHFEGALLALEQARKYALAGGGGGGFTAAIAQEETVVAWLAGDDAAVEEFFEEIRHTNVALVPPHLRAIGDAWNNGEAERLAHDEIPRRRAFALLLMAAKAPEGDRRRSLLNEAQCAANVAEDLWTRLLVTVARAVSETAVREELIGEALSLAHETGRPELVASVTSLKERGSGHPTLAALATRFAPEPSSLQANVVRVNALSRTVVRGEERLDLSNRVLSLVLILAVLKRARRETISELLWGEAATDGGVYALKVLVSRARKQLGDPSLIVVANGYCSLRDDVVVDLAEIQLWLRSLPTEDCLADSKRARLQDVYGQFTRFPSSGYGEAIPSIEAVIIRTQQQVLECLGRDAIARGETGLAIETAEKLRQIDCDDEAASEILIRALMVSGNRIAAMREYRAYSERLERLFAVEPSFSIDELLRAVKPAS